MRQRNGRPRESTANVVRSPACTGSAGGWASTRRTLRPGTPGMSPACGGRTGAVPALPARSRTVTAIRYVPAGASLPSSRRPSQLAVATPGPFVAKRATTCGGPSSVRSTRKNVGPRRETSCTVTCTGPANGPVIHWSPRTSGFASSRAMAGRGGVTSSRTSRGTVIARPCRRRLTRTW